MEFKTYIRRLIIQYPLESADDKKEVVMAGLRYILKQCIECNYEEMIKKIKEFLLLLYDYGFFETKNFYNLKELLENRAPFREVEIFENGRKLKILGEEDFFLYLSRIFYDIVMDARMRQALYDEKKKLLEFHFNIEE